MSDKTPAEKRKRDAEFMASLQGRQVCDWCSYMREKDDPKKACPCCGGPWLTIGKDAEVRPCR